jgi:8-oxo-dGTP pyrophosphatase MutT (NUDIX family)
MIKKPISPDDPTFFRLTAKAVIKDEQGRVLLAREPSGTLGLPGGGIEHGEAIRDCLTRELYEELHITVLHSAVLRGVFPYYSHNRGAWWAWLLYDVQADLPPKLTGELTDAAFVDVDSFARSTDRAQRRIYEALHTGLAL